VSDAFYTHDGAHYLPSPLTRGPWDARYQHGGPPSALLTRALTADGFLLVRVTVALLRPVPLTPLTLQTEPVRGRVAQRPVARLLAGGTVVAEARGLRIRRAPLEVPEPEPVVSWPPPDALPELTLDFFPHPVGYHQAVELRRVHGEWGRTPIGVWGRPRVPLVAGTQTTPHESLMVLADAQSGLGTPLDPQRYSFVNPDLTVYLERDPVGPWFGFEIRSVVGPQGSGVSQSEVRDQMGCVGRSAQALVAALR
jgi:hypothetical protein